MPDGTPKRIDMHVHVGVLGDHRDFKSYGAISQWMRKQLVFRIMLLYGRIEPDRVSDESLRDAALRTITTSGLDHVVCLALDPVYDDSGARRLDLSNFWVANEYITKELIPRSGGRILLGASVHPYDPAFRDRVHKCVEDGALLLKWLPSAQQINLADPRVRDALVFLATAGRGGRPLPLLLHVGVEYAIITTDPRTTSWDFLSWGFWDRVGNALRSKSKRWHVPNVAAVLANLGHGHEAGARIILAHCGLPYFAPRLFRFAEHDDFPVVRRLLEFTAQHSTWPGRIYADVSACATPFRKSYFGAIRKLPPELLLAGSDFPVPVFELSADLKEHLADFEAIVARGELERIVVPQDNLLEVNWRELKHVFGEHPMFHNAAPLLFG